MRQPNNPVGNLLSIRAHAGDFASLTVTITNDQRVETLKTSGKGRPWSLGEKKKIAVDLLELEADIKRDIAVIDPTNNFDISEKFDTTVEAYQSKNHIKGMNNLFEYGRSYPPSQRGESTAIRGWPYTSGDVAE